MKGPTTGSRHSRGYGGRVKLTGSIQLANEHMDEHRNHRLKMNRVSVSADMLKERCSDNGTTFAELRQADFFLSLRSLVSFDPEELVYRQIWRARTSVYASDSKLTLFQKAISADVREGIRTALDVNNGEEMKQRIDTAKAAMNGFGGLLLDRYTMDNFAELTNLAALMR